MARKNTYSLSWFKKRTAEINRLLRTTATVRRTRKGRQIVTYSPAEEYRLYQAAQRRGETTAFVQRFRQDPRSAAGVATYREEGGVLNLELRRVWAPLAAKNFYVANLLNNAGDPDVFADGAGELWRRVLMDDGTARYVRILPMGRLGDRPILSPPPPLRPLTTKLANQLAAARARKINTRKSGAGGAGGGGSPTEEYMDE